MIQRANPLSQLRPPRLVSLLWRDAGYYAYGDPKQHVIEPRPAGVPCVVSEIPSDAPYSLIAISVESIVPPHINAFILGGPIFRYGASKLYDLAYQFFTIPRDDYQRVINLPRDERMLGGYFPSEGRPGTPF